MGGNPGIGLHTAVIQQWHQNCKTKTENPSGPVGEGQRGVGLSLQSHSPSQGQNPPGHQQGHREGMRTLPGPCAHMGVIPATPMNSLKDVSSPHKLNLCWRAGSSCCTHPPLGLRAVCSFHGQQHPGDERESDGHPWAEHIENRAVPWRESQGDWLVLALGSPEEVRHLPALGLQLSPSPSLLTPDHCWWRSTGCSGEGGQNHGITELQGWKSP